MIPLRLAAARLLWRLERAGIDLCAAGAELKFRAEPGALTDSIRAEIAAYRSELVALLAELPVAVSAAAHARRFALVVAREDPEWRQAGYGGCVVCNHGTIWSSPDGQPMHPSCDPLLGVV